MNPPDAAWDDPHDLLSATRGLTRRVRVAQRGAWFPLLAFAAVTLAAIPFNRYGPHPRHCSSFRAGSVCIVQPTLALWYWPVAVVAAYVAISWFYLHRSHRRGVGTRVWPYVAVGAVLALLIGAWALWANTHPAFLADTLRLFRPGQPANNLLYRIASPAAAIGLALLLLSWIERSWPLFTLTVAYLIVTVATVGVQWFAHPSPWAFLPHLLIDAAVLLLGSIILAVSQRPQAPPSA